MHFIQYEYSRSHAYCSSGSLYQAQRVECIVATPGFHLNLSPLRKAHLIAWALPQCLCFYFCQILSSFPFSMTFILQTQPKCVLISSGSRWRNISSPNAFQETLFSIISHYLLSLQLAHFQYMFIIYCSLNICLLFLFLFSGHLFFSQVVILKNKD